MIHIFVLLRPSPERIFECFVEVTAPSDDGEGKLTDISLYLGILCRKFRQTNPVLEEPLKLTKQIFKIDVQKVTMCINMKNVEL